MEFFHHGWMSGGHSGFMLLIWLLAIIALIGLGYMLGRSSRGRDERR